MIFLKFLLVLFWLGIVPFLSGSLIVNRVLKLKKYDLLLSVVCGYFCMLSVFYLLCMPMLFFKCPLHILVIAWSIVMILLCSAGFYTCKIRYHEIWQHIKKIRTLPWFTIVVVLLILFQSFLLVWYVHDDIDDALYVGAATTAVSTDTISQIDPYTGDPSLSYEMRNIMSPFAIFTACISSLVSIHPAILAHTVFPAFFVSLSYIVYIVIGKKLFPKDAISLMLFLLFLCFLNIYGNVSIYTNSTFLLFRIWQGKAFLANIVLPGIFYFSSCAMSGEQRLAEWLMLFMCSLTACLSSSMGIILSPVMIGCLGLLFAFRNKKLTILFYSIAVCSPFIVCGAAYLIL